MTKKPITEALASIAGKELLGFDGRHSFFAFLDAKKSIISLSTFEWSEFLISSFEESQLFGTVFYGAKMTGCVLDRATMGPMKKPDGTEVFTSFSGADLFNAFLSSVSARNVSFADADLRGALLLYSEFFDCDFSGADLRCTELGGTQFHGDTKWEGAKISKSTDAEPSMIEEILAGGGIMEQ